MRQIFVQTARGAGQRVRAIAQEYEAKNLVCLPSEQDGQAAELIIVHLSNGRVGDFIRALEEDDLPDVQITFAPQGVFPLSVPSQQVPEQVTNVEARSPIEVLLGALQSIGSWKGFLGYAIVAAIIVWIGLYTDSVILLIAAMLIAPFAGPAMNVAVASARGDWYLLRRSVVRYFAAITVAIGVSAVITFLMQSDVVTATMSSMGEVSSIAALLPLVVGAAGALNLIQSERSSLVSGTATGVLVAASLSPPAGLIGMAAVLREGDLLRAGVFLVLLQLVGINLTGTLMFRLYGANAETSQYQRGEPRIFYLAMAVTIVALAGLLFWQFSNPPDLQRSTRTQRAAEVIKDTVSQYEPVYLIETQVRFTREDIPQQNSLLVDVYVQRRPDRPTDAETIRAELTRRLQDALRQDFDVTPLVSVTVLDPPEPSS